MEHLSSEERLRQLGLFCLEKTRPWAHLLATFQDFQGASQNVGDMVFCKDGRISTRDNSSQHKEGRFRSGLRKKPFMTRVLKHRHRLPREPLAAPSPGTFKVRSDEALSNLIYLTTSLLLADHLA